MPIFRQHCSCTEGRVKVEKSSVQKLARWEKAENAFCNRPSYQLNFQGHPERYWYPHAAPWTLSTVETLWDPRGQPPSKDRGTEALGAGDAAGCQRPPCRGRLPGHHRHLDKPALLAQGHVDQDGLVLDNLEVSSLQLPTSQTVLHLFLVLMQQLQHILRIWDISMIAYNAIFVLFQSVSLLNFFSLNQVNTWWVSFMNTSPSPCVLKLLSKSWMKQVAGLSYQYESFSLYFFCRSLK